jgi:hypothetical protein
LSSFPSHVTIGSPVDPERYLQRLEPELLTSFSPEQLTAIRQLLQAVVPKPSPKIVDIRVVINLIVQRYYVVLWMGKDIRRAQRSDRSWLARVVNLGIAALLLVGLNLLITMTTIGSLYLLKSALGINIFADHFGDRINSLFH